MAPTASKLIFTDRARLRAKYGAAGLRAVTDAVRVLAARDRERGIRTRLVSIDGSGAESVKAAVDGAHAAAHPPDYVVLLGAPDVVAAAELANPLWTGDPDDDPDRTIASDLPYACAAPLGAAAAAFRAPSRVVGRVPDLVGATAPTYLLGVLRRSSTWTARRAPRPLAVMAVSTLTWRRSTQTSIAALSGAAGTVHTCPAEGPDWPGTAFDVPLVFVNCHGADLDPAWYGERTAGQVELPPAVEAARLRRGVRRGAVVAAECCYGGAHWDPARAGGQAGVAQTFLARGAAGVFASSTVAYGPPVGNSAADIITRLFLEGVAAGASLGRAALEARQRYVALVGSLGPIDLKTLAQFDLLGDPSVHPVAPVVTDDRTPAESPHRPPAGVTRRRAMLRSSGEALAATVPSADRPLRRPGISPDAFAAAAGLRGRDAAGLRIRSFAVDDPGGDPDRASLAAAPSRRRGRERFHVAFVQRGRQRSVVQVHTAPDEPPTAVRVVPKR